MKVIFLDPKIESGATAREGRAIERCALALVLASHQETSFIVCGSGLAGKPYPAIDMTQEDVKGRLIRVPGEGAHEKQPSVVEQPSIIIASNPARSARSVLGDTEEPRVCSNSSMAPRTA